MQLSLPDSAMFFVFVWIISFQSMDALTRLCSQCTSKQSHTCEEKPPEATPCIESSKPTSCKIVRKYIEGKQIEFTRACSTLKRNEHKSQDCIISDLTNVTTCYELCYSDSCNSKASEAIFNVKLTPFLFSLVATVFNFL